MRGMCPYCGKDVKVRNGLTVDHYLALVVVGQMCPGSYQHYRNAESDGRPLWNGKSNPRFYRNALTEEDR